MRQVAQHKLQTLICLLCHVRIQGRQSIRISAWKLSLKIGQQLERISRVETILIHGHEEDRPIVAPCLHRRMRSATACQFDYQCRRIWRSLFANEQTRTSQISIRQYCDATGRVIITESA